MGKTYIEDGVLISVLSENGSINQCNIKFLAGSVVNDQAEIMTTDSYLITLQLEWYSNYIFITKDEKIFETSNLPVVIEVTCAEFLLMRTCSFKVDDILRIRQCTDKARLIAAFDD